MRLTAANTTVLVLILVIQTALAEPAATHLGIPDSVLAKLRVQLTNTPLPAVITPSKLVPTIVGLTPQLLMVEVVVLQPKGQIGSHFVINMTVVPGVDTVTFTIQGKDSLGNYYTLLASTAIVATGITVLKICPGITASANAAAADELPDMYRILCTHSAASDFNYTAAENGLF